MKPDDLPLPQSDLEALKRRASDAINKGGGLLGRHLAWTAETVSTNDDAKLALKEGAPHGATWVTELQRAGRGRQGRGWFAASGESLLFSVILRVDCPPMRVPSLALAVGLAVRDAVAGVVPGSKVELKWPNDVLIDEKKVAGVLIETTRLGGAVGGLVVGVGINTHTTQFPEAIAARATSIALAARNVPDRAELLADVLIAIEQEVPRVAEEGLELIHSRLAEHDALRGRMIRAEGVSGVAEGIGKDGCLLVRRLPDGALLRWSAGEVRLDGVASSDAGS